MWAVAQVAKEFHQLPSVVARDLDNDPSRLSLEVLPLLRYRDAWSAWESHTDPKQLEPWERTYGEGPSIMDQVRDNAMYLRHLEAHPKQFVEDCEGCDALRAEGRR